ncbi:MAG: hypothetical protein HRT44_09040, partial [Bdellovibrionales bacterium]|nr:hypothetical protein [Bdellovibrionales bacterium]NQZ19385.1 hypothetical protein [Bdellovibrionales bacterium]
MKWIKPLLTLVVLLIASLVSAEPGAQPYTRMVIRNSGFVLSASGGKKTCSQAFSSYGSQFSVMDSFYRDPHKDRNGFQVPILRRIDRDYPNRLEVRVSRFFKVSDRPYRGPYERNVEGDTLPNQMNQPTIDLLRRWGADFNYGESTDQNLIRETRAIDPLRKTHIGFRLDDSYWAGLDLFDGSTTLRLFDEMGKLDT